MSKHFFFALILASRIYGLDDLCAQAKPKTADSTATNVRVPFVGCRSDGQTGPLEAPNGQPKVVDLSAEAAKQLAYFQAEEGIGVLAPRGWYCFAIYGSNGNSLFVSPRPINPSDLFSAEWKGFTGPAIQVSASIGDTSGRFKVAETIARVFPAHSAFLRRVIAEGIEPASSFPSGPYPNDKLLYHSDDFVEYETPAESKGLGTDSRLKPNDSPICGFALLTGETPDLIFLAIRLPAEFATLTAAILHQAVHEGTSFAP
jgi:hypothetical protein